MTDRTVGGHGRPDLRPRPRRSRRTAPACEPLEPRALLATTAAPAPAVTVTLAPGYETGTAPFGELTNFRQPTFAGTAPKYGVVQLAAQRVGDGGPRPLGQVVADPTGHWSLSVGPLLDGLYDVRATVTAPGTAAATDPGSFPMTTFGLTRGGVGPLLLGVETGGPRVSDLAFDPAAGQIAVTFQDAGFGLNTALLANPANYTLVRAGDPRGLHPVALAPSPAISGFYSGAVTETLTVVGGPLRPGRYTFQVASPGVVSLAGNPLDGEFTGFFPSGDGHPGGNFIATLTVPRPARVPRAHPGPWLRRH